MSHDGEFVRFDNKYIYLSLLEFDVVSEIKNRINDSKCVTSVYKCGLIELAILLLEFMSFTIDKKYCNERRGLFIDAPTSACLAEIEELEKI